MTESHSREESDHRPASGFFAHGGDFSASWIVLAALIAFAAAALARYLLSRIKDSEAGRLAVKSVRENPAAREALGAIRATGWPLGSLSVDADGTGAATFSMWVNGSKDSGRYSTTLVRENSTWRSVSARLTLDDGRSIDVEGTRPATKTDDRPKTSHTATVTHGGRQLRSEPQPESGWQSVEWAGRHVVFEVPREWTRLSTDERLLEFRPDDRSGYMLGEVEYFDQKIAFEPLVDVLLAKAADELARYEILGYTRRDIGKARGLMQIAERAGEYPQAAWTGYFDTDESGTVCVNLLLGTRTHDDFDEIEPLLGAIVDSVQVR